MKWLAVIPVVVIVAVLVAVGGYPIHSFRYRITVNVDVDGQLRSGSSVIEVTAQNQPRVTPESGGVLTKAYGEAVYVDLGDGRNLVALLASGPTAAGVDYPQHLVPRHFGLTGEERDLVQYSNLSGSWTLSAGELPTFVTFADTKDPGTARVQNPADLERTFGARVRLRDVLVEMTNDQVTVGIEQRLPWIKEWIAKGLAGRINGRSGVFVANVPYFKRT